MLYQLSYTRITLVEITGIEPVVALAGGFTVHCITVDASSPNMVPQGRLELPRLSTMASKTIVSTIPPPGQKLSIVKYYVQILR